MKTGLAAAVYVMKYRYAWPGGPALALIMSTGDILCPDCIRAEFENIAWAWINKVPDGWFPVRLIVLDDPAYKPTCAPCGREI